MNGWRQVKLGDIADEVTVGHVGSMAQEYRTDGIPLLRSQNVLPHGFDLKDVKYIDKDFHARLKKSALRAGDVVTVRTGKPGATAVVPPQWAEANCSDLVITRPGNEINSHWLSYYINSAATGYIDSQLVGAVQQHFNVGAAKNMTLNLPPLPEQEAIAEVLNAFDDKIALNVQLSGTTERFLDASYRGAARASQTTPVLVESLVRRITPKRKFAKDELLTHGEFPVFDQSDTGLLGYLNGNGFFEASPNEPLLYFGDHTCKLRIAAQRFTVGPNTIPFTGFGIPPLTLYCALNGLQNHEEYKRHWQLLMKKEVSVPEAHTATEFAVRHGHLLSMLNNLRRENASLASVRDALLPQLMSGKLRVKDAQKVLEEAGV